MAIKQHQKVTHDDINFACNSVAAAGAVVIYSGTQVTLAAGLPAPTSRVAGILMQDVVAGIHPSNVILGDFTGTIDTARNFHRNQTHVSGIVRLLKIGEIETNMISSGTMAAGDPLYLDENGQFTDTDQGRQQIGHALGATDADGYVKIWVNIQ
jgi:hypothetical protein